MKQGITIEANSVPDNNAIHPEMVVLPDKNLTLDTSFLALDSSIGSASHRSLQGVNTVIRRGTLSFSNRPYVEIEYLKAFLIKKSGYNSFNLIIKDDNGRLLDDFGNKVSKLVLICTKVRTSYNFYDNWSLFAEVEEVFNADEIYAGNSIGSEANQGDQFFTQPDYLDNLD